MYGTETSSSNLSAGSPSVISGAPISPTKATTPFSSSSSRKQRSGRLLPHAAVKEESSVASSNPSSSSSSALGGGDAASGNLLFEDRFAIRSVDWGRFENVLRMRGKSSAFDADVILDVHAHLFPVKQEESVYLGLTTTVGSSNTKDEWLSSNTILEDYDYAMHGRVFKIDEKTTERRTVYASYGGLIMSLTADKQILGELQVDMRVYLLLRRSEDIVKSLRY